MSEEIDESNFPTRPTAPLSKDGALAKFHELGRKFVRLSAAMAVAPTLNDAGSAFKAIHELEVDFMSAYGPGNLHLSNDDGFRTMDEVLGVGDAVLYPFVLEMVKEVGTPQQYTVVIDEHYLLQKGLVCACGHMLTVEGLCPDDSSYRKD